MTRIALLITGVIGTLAATAPAQPKAPQAKATTATRPTPEITKQSAAFWIHDFGKMNYKEGKLVPLSRPDLSGC
ncbi:MAG: hypothetical protein U0133_17600 [Gemmatimonadales bacterium]